jgi:hypothetical protein
MVVIAYRTVTETGEKVSGSGVPSGALATPAIVSVVVPGAIASKSSAARSPAPEAPV